VVLEPVIVGGPPPLPARLPEVASRAGIDLEPVDVHDVAGTRWLRACLWPEQPERIERLEAAIGIAREAPPPLLRGDALALLPGVIAAAPPEATVCVFHSMVMTYFPREYRAHFIEVLRVAALRRPIAWVALEAPRVVPGIVPPALEDGADAERTSAMIISLTLLDGARREDRVLARAHPHGAWLEWLGQ
jgi:hypothetical protein